jgi:hypothetical protein
MTISGLASPYDCAHGCPPHREQNGGAVEGDIFHRTLSIDENSQFEGSSRRVENPTEPSSSVDAKGPQKSPQKKDLAPAPFNGKIPKDGRRNARVIREDDDDAANDHLDGRPSLATRDRLLQRLITVHNEPRSDLFTQAPFPSDHRQQPLAADWSRLSESGPVVWE